MEKKNLYSFISFNLFNQIFKFIPDSNILKMKLSLYSKKLQHKLKLSIYDFQALYVKKNFNFEDINFSFDLLYNQISLKFNKNSIQKFYYKFLSENLIINLHTINYFNVVKIKEKIKEMENNNNPPENIIIILKNESYNVLNSLSIDYSKIKKFKLYQKDKDNNIELFNWNIFEKFFTYFYSLSENLIELELLNIIMDNLEPINKLKNLKYLYLNNIQKSSQKNKLILKLKHLEKIKLFNIEIEFENDEIFNSLESIIFYKVEFSSLKKILLIKAKNIIMNNCKTKTNILLIFSEVNYLIIRECLFNIDYKSSINYLSKIHTFELSSYENIKFPKMKKFILLKQEQFLNKLEDNILSILNISPNINEIYINTIYLDLKEIETFKKNSSFTNKYNICSVEINEEQILKNKLKTLNEIIGKDDKNQNNQEKYYDFYLINNCNSLENKIECPGTFFIQLIFSKNLIIPFENLFKGSSNLTSINLTTKGLFKKIKSMNFMFLNCESLKSVILNNFDTSKVKSMKGLFYNCKNLLEVDLSNFNTGKVTSMNSMFYYCKSLENLNLSSFNTKNVTDMSHMFDNCSLLINIDVSCFKTKKVITMSSMFYNCKSLTEIDLSNFNTKKVNDMSEMFSYCSSLNLLDLSSFTVQKTTNINSIFNNINKKCEIITYDDIIEKQNPNK